MTALHPTFCSWIAELILLTWGENSQHHCQCHSAVPGPFHSKTLPAPLLLPKYSQWPNQGLHYGLHFNAFMSSFPACQMLAQEKRIMHMADALPELPAGRLEELCGSTGHTTGLPEADQVPAQRPGHHCTRGHLQSVLQVSLHMCVHSTAIHSTFTPCSVGPLKTTWFQGFGTTFQQELRGSFLVKCFHEKKAPLFVRFRG